ncbi:MAG TPA: hypothetical protein PLP95_05935 [Microthrixaceae bacterium]|nr:hypothetical protein [Microthrixaceae bacterium]
MSDSDIDSPVRRYVELGLRLGRHNPDIVDSYYGPKQWRDRIDAEPVRPAEELRDAAGELIAEFDADTHLGSARARWLRSQTVGLHTVARHLAGERIEYLDEVELCYGVRPERITTDEVMAAQHALDRALKGASDEASAPLSQRLAAMRERHVIPVDKLRGVIDNLAQELRARTRAAFGLPDEEGVSFDLVSDKPWSGFNVYQGGFHSLVTINTDLPVLSTSIAHLIAHEAYPGHHTEGCRKELGLVRERGQLEQSIALIGTPSCLLAEGLADLGLEALVGPDTHAATEPMLRDAGVHIELESVQALSVFSETLARARGTLALMLHADAAPVDDVVRTAQQWFVIDEARATQMVRFLTDPTWRAYVFCYAEGHRLCRAFMAGDPRRFARLLDEQFTPQELAAAA